MNIDFNSFTLKPIFEWPNKFADAINGSTDNESLENNTTVY